MHHPTRKSPRRHLLSTALLVACLGAGAGAAFAQTGPVSGEASVSISSQPLPAALSDFTEQTGVQVIVPAGLPAGLQSRAVTGRQSPAEAIGKLLAGTGLAWRVVDGSTIALERAPQGDADVQVTDAVRIVGSGAGAGLSEGSGRYAKESSSTATGLGLSLRETPQSMTVITRQRLDDAGPVDLTRVLAETTGIFVQTTDSERISFYSRGYSIQNFQVDGSLNSYRDGYRGSLKPDMALYDSIEVVRGSVGLLTGSGDPSGSVNLIRKRAPREFLAQVGLSVGRWDNRRLDIDVGGPLALDGRVRGRLTVAKQQSDSFRDNYRRDNGIFLGTLEADITDNTTLTVGHEYQNPETWGASWGAVKLYFNDGTPTQWGRSTNLAADWSQWPIRESKTFARIEHAFAGGWKASLDYSESTRSGEGMSYYAGSGYPRHDGTGLGIYGSLFTSNSETDVINFKANGPFRLFGREHELLVGYSDEDYVQSSPVTVFGDDPYPGYWSIPDWRVWDGDIPKIGDRTLPLPSSATRYRQKAGYLAARLNLADRWKAVLGARYGDWETETTNWTYDANNDYALRGAVTSGYRAKDVVTPYAGLLWDFGERYTAYVSYTDIFQPQSARDANFKVLDPITGVTYEAGVKGEFFDGLLNASVAVFRSEKDNLAEHDDSLDLLPGQFDPENPPEGYNEGGNWLLPDGGVPYRSTGKGNKVEGYELELQGAITADWNIMGGYTYAVSRNAAGEQINGARPVRILRLNTTWRLPGAWSRLTVGGGVSWQSDIWGNVNRPNGELVVDRYGNLNPAGYLRIRSTQKAFALASLMARYRIADTTTLSLNVSNLFDKHYYDQPGFYDGVHWGEPRNWTLSLQHRF